MIEKLVEYFRKSVKETTGKTPEGYCPNCWGNQEYAHKIREMYEDKQIDVNNHEENYAFIQDFIITYIEGIKLKKGSSGLECPTCKLKY